MGLIENNWTPTYRARSVPQSARKRAPRILNLLARFGIIRGCWSQTKGPGNHEWCCNTDKDGNFIAPYCVKI